MKKKRKRKNEPANQKVKRVKFTDFKYSANEEFSDLDFRFAVLEPQIPFDIIVANQTSEFSCHKNILIKISCVFKNLLQGDQNMKVLRLDDISDKNLNKFQKLIYVRPSERGEVVTVDVSYTLDDLLNIILLASKYDVNFMDPTLNYCLEKVRLETGKEIGLLWNTLRQHNLHGHAAIVSKVHSVYDHVDDDGDNDGGAPECLFDSLEGMPIEILIEMAKHNSGIFRIAKLLKHVLSLHSQNSVGVKEFKSTVANKILVEGFRYTYHKTILKILLNVNTPP